MQTFNSRDIATLSSHLGKVTSLWSQNHLFFINNALYRSDRLFKYTPKIALSCPIFIVSIARPTEVSYEAVMALNRTSSSRALGRFSLLSSIDGLYVKCCPILRYIRLLLVVGFRDHEVEGTVWNMSLKSVSLFIRRGRSIRVSSPSVMDMRYAGEPLKVAQHSSTLSIMRLRDISTSSKRLFRGHLFGLMRFWVLNPDYSIKHDWQPLNGQRLDAHNSATSGAREDPKSIAPGKLASWDNALPRKIFLEKPIF
ncbi:uncharacterized protein BDR25DRAFT_359462 [Lindgomyces ingoldianus]|uniref:Uncharacterized protein n=1 Tax=Lindgomyces ingoldianus TaxID=673940 RepID=A0ACB6QKA5_9PLEO|nr:uncharacterized protein BDR25DRAFT_359462 [Lindgomyces ingoldianus]KAF2466565.1 hypothetical protein BDR25DRAFT_359462 [Lindgomyces ingoldianus]